MNFYAKITFRQDFQRAAIFLLWLCSRLFFGRRSLRSLRLFVRPAFGFRRSSRRRAFVMLEKKPADRSRRAQSRITPPPTDGHAPPQTTKATEAATPPATPATTPTETATQSTSKQPDPTPAGRKPATRTRTPDDGHRRQNATDGKPPPHQQTQAPPARKPTNQDTHQPTGNQHQNTQDDGHQAPKARPQRNNDRQTQQTPPQKKADDNEPRPTTTPTHGAPMFKRTPPSPADARETRPPDCPRSQRPQFERLRRRACFRLVAFRYNGRPVRRPYERQTHPPNF